MGNTNEMRQLTTLTLMKPAVELILATDAVIFALKGTFGISDSDAARFVNDSLEDIAKAHKKTKELQAECEKNGIDFNDYMKEHVADTKRRTGIDLDQMYKLYEEKFGGLSYTNTDKDNNKTN